MVEAESYLKQAKDAVRRWEIIDTGVPINGLVDPDESHHATASGKAYLEALPDTRVTHDDVLTPGINFSNEPGKMAILDYKVKFTTPGRYYVWVRAFSSGAEDNGIHVGLNGEWPESGQRMQWCEGKNNGYGRVSNGPRRYTVGKKSCCIWTSPKREFIRHLFPCGRMVSSLMLLSSVRSMFLRKTARSTPGYVCLEKRLM